MSARILVAEDEDSLSELIRYNLEKEGFEVVTAADGEETLMLIAEQPPDLLLLDWMLPRAPGVEVCRRLRARPATKALPILMLTARSEEADKIRGLDTGADDYMVKPFSMNELIARIRALLRRARPGLTEDQLTYGDISVDRLRHRVDRAGEAVHLGPTEYKLLEFLMQQPGRVFSRERLLDAVWGANTYVELRTVDVHIGRLRKALNQPGLTDPIRTIRSAGYALDLQG